MFGASVAELHHLSDGFETEHVRSRLEVEYLLDESVNIIKPFLRNKKDDLTFLEETADELRRAVNSIAIKSLDVGFCHGDCHGCNVHESEGLLTHFDFDCCGFGFRVFELATFKWGIFGDDNQSELWSSFLDGYRSEREIGDEDFSLIDTFVVIRHIWWMALIMGNARDFGHRATSDEFIDHQLGRIGKLMKRHSVL
ncbi:phosphotransferase enzyme family protein [Granulosicoccus antarcticus]|uniref:phosphotransferase enzyme family protein n=1 Tax=Granulosicoccus antarcticus TaxID=437505 RepID=UPI000B5A614B|nr:phosphotransferase [Granulosicoccus antarcticus]